MRQALLAIALFAVRFQEVAPEAGIEFVHRNHPTPSKHLIETMPGGVAVFDYDGDGLPDIFFTNGAEIPALEKSDATYSNRLYRNRGRMKFEDVTSRSGLSGEGYSMGAAAADFDNDGHVDLFVAGVQRNRLYRNLGNGKFADATASSGIKSDRWSVAAGWFDYDNDADLDLFVVNYVKWTPAFDRFCGDAGKKLRVYCHPKYFDGLPNTLYRNNADGTFADVSDASGVANHIGRGMSVAFADYDADGWMDAFVTNDNLPNFLFRNAGGKRFEEQALAAGVAMLDHGKPISSMGADFRDYNNDGLPDIHVTALNGETYPLFLNQGKGTFRDATYASGVGPLSRTRAGWSNGLYDFDNDGWKDIFTANSHVNDRIERFEPATYKQSNSIFVNLANGKFRDASAEAGFDGSVRAHRGSAVADFDRDGRLDIVVTALGEAAELWHNQSTPRHWLNLKLVGTKSNRDGIGARVTAGSQHAHVTTAIGYASSVHDGIHFGLGDVLTVERIEVRWPSGQIQTLSDVKADQLITVREP